MAKKKKIADDEEVLVFLTSVMRSDRYTVKERIKAASRLELRYRTISLNKQNSEDSGKLLELLEGMNE